MGRMKKEVIREDVLPSEETSIKTMKNILSIIDKGEAPNLGEFIKAARGIVEEYENTIPRQSQNYKEGEARKQHIVRILTTFTLTAPPKIKDNDRVDWGWQAVYDLTKKVEDLSGGDVQISIEYPWSVRNKFAALA